MEAFLHEDREWRPMEEEEDPLTHLLLPDSLELLEKVEHKLKKKRRNRLKKQRHRQFNDLWVRMEERCVEQNDQIFQIPDTLILRFGLKRKFEVCLVFPTEA